MTRSPPAAARPVLPGVRGVKPEQPFERGESVRRKRNDRVMTVEADYGSLFTFRVRCAWDDDGARKSEMFRPDELERAERARE
jgi:hypothetical protein